MKNPLYSTALLIILCITCLSSCNGNAQLQSDTSTPPVGNTHIHSFGEWITSKNPTCTETGIYTRYCTCGEKQTETIAATGHTEVLDVAISATCVADGKTEGKHCSACNEIIVPQTIIQKLGHSEVSDAAIAATCSTPGKTEGKHCSVCNEIIVAQTTIEKLEHSEVIDSAVLATCTTSGQTEGKHCGLCNEIIVPQTTIAAIGHKYNSGTISVQATCISNGTLLFSCQNANCTHSYTETYSLHTYSATELFNQAVKYVGEIITYDKRGEALSLGTGFTISPDGKILTNYHVIDGAWSAQITINGTNYPVSSVLAYNIDIDLAVLKIDAQGLPSANICKLPVRVGSTIYAIGSSRGMTNTYSQGIVTYADRIIEGVSHIQHDASITHGNSGGPLINIYGEVIGVNTWGLTDSQNLNFAVSASEIDNLTYGPPIALPELHNKHQTASEALIAWVYDNYTSTYLDGTVISAEEFSKNHTYSISYDIVEQCLFIDVMDDVLYFSLDLDTELSEYNYYFSYESDSFEYTIIGTVNPKTFTENTPLTNYKYDGPSFNQEAAISLAQTAMCSTLSFFNYYLLVNDLDMNLIDFNFLIYAQN